MIELFLTCDVYIQGLNDAGERSYTNASDNYAYLKNPIWWAGMSTSEFCCLRRRVFF